MMTSNEMSRLADMTAQRLSLNETAMTVTQCAAYLGRSPEAIHKMAQRGQLPVHRVSRRLYFFKNEINQFIQNL